MTTKPSFIAVALMTACCASGCNDQNLRIQTLPIADVLQFTAGAKVIAGTLLPLAPSEITVTPQSASHFKLNWNDNSHDEDGFIVERRASGTTDMDDCSKIISQYDRL